MRDRARSSLHALACRVALVFLLAVATSGAAGASSAFGEFLQLAGFSPDRHGFIEIDPSPALNPTGALTFEAWIFNHGTADAPEGCVSIAGKNFTTAWWVGICGNTLRSYMRGGGSGYDVGHIPLDEWTHIAVVFDGVTHKHYVNGVLVGSRAEAGPLTVNSAPVRIGSDVGYDVPFKGGIDEVHLWNVARSAAQVVADRDAVLSAPAPGLVSVWHLDGPLSALGTDAIGGHDGFAVLPGASIGCGEIPDYRTNCLGEGARFVVTVTWEDFAHNHGDGTAVPMSDDTGSFWFFGPSNTELVVKVLDGRGLNGKFWVYYGAITNVHFTLSVTDTVTGHVKQYDNPSGNFASRGDVDALPGS